MSTRWLYLVLTASFAEPSHAEQVDKVAATVNKDIIALSEVETRAAPELAKAAVQADPKLRTDLRQTALHQALDLLIGEKLLETEMHELNIEVSEQEIDLGLEDVRKNNNLESAQFEELLRNEGYTLASYRQFMRKHLARLKVINLKVRNRVKLSDEDLKSEYQRWSKSEAGDVEIHARHILVKWPSASPSSDEVEAARKKALGLAIEARQPGKDFGALAKSKSDGPSAADGGDLGFFRRGMMVPEFDRIAFAQRDGEISDPVRTRFGWHVIKTEERRAVPPKKFDEVKDQLRERLMRSQLEKYTDQYVKELRDNAAVEVKI